MQLKKIYDLIDKCAPFSLSEEYCSRYGAYDNSGILVDCGEDVTGILFSLDCSLASVREAERVGADLLVTHHPAIYAPVRSLQGEDAVLAAARRGISVISAHLNLDCAGEGIDEMLMEGLGGSEPVLMHPLSAGGYGRAFRLCIGVGELAARIRSTFSTDKVLVYGRERPLSRVASFCGAGLDEAALAFAAEQGADALVTSDGKHHLIAAAVERGMNLFLLPHYAAENYGFYHFYQKIKGELGVPCEFYTDGRLL